MWCVKALKEGIRWGVGGGARPRWMLKISLRRNGDKVIIGRLLVTIRVGERETRFDRSIIEDLDLKLKRVWMYVKSLLAGEWIIDYVMCARFGWGRT